MVEKYLQSMLKYIQIGQYHDKFVSFVLENYPQINAPSFENVTPPGAFNRDYTVYIY